MNTTLIFCKLEDIIGKGFCASSVGLAVMAWLVFASNILNMAAILCQAHRYFPVDEGEEENVLEALPISQPTLLDAEVYEMKL